MEGFKDRHLHACAGEVAGATEAGGTGADHRGSEGQLFGRSFDFGLRCGKSIRNIPFQRADGDRFTLAPKDASAFALVGLGAYAPAYAGQ